MKIRYFNNIHFTLQNTGIYEIVECDVNEQKTLNFLTNESQCIVTGCYTGFGRAPDKWISPITCNIEGWYVYTTHVLLSICCYVMCINILFEVIILYSTYIYK